MIINVSRTAIDNYMWQVTRYLYKHHGTDAGNRMIAPLYWYIETGRGSSDFLRKLIACKPFVVARILARGGSNDSILMAVKKRVGAE